tara:strand:+ start:88 stop:564 length:477 start_codon:yes stop_codon:yes gene_type:complete
MSIDLRKLASERERLHENHSSSRPLSKDYEYIGLKGEEKFAEEFSMEIDEKLRPGGDGGRDFPSHVGIVDVKTARKAYNLIVEEGKVVSDIYVLAKYTDDIDEAELLGWAYKNEVLDAPCKDFGYGIINHYIPKDSLYPILSLKNILFKQGELNDEGN